MKIGNDRKRAAHTAAAEGRLVADPGAAGGNPFAAGGGGGVDGAEVDEAELRAEGAAVAALAAERLAVRLAAAFDAGGATPGRKVRFQGYRWKVHSQITKLLQARGLRPNLFVRCSLCILRGMLIASRMLVSGHTSTFARHILTRSCPWRRTRCAGGSRDAGGGGGARAGARARRRRP